MKAFIHFIVGDDIRLASLAIGCVLGVWVFHALPVAWLLFPIAITSALLMSVLYRRR